MDYKRFRREIWAYYKKSGRVLPWRQTRDPYKILVSELMLQQTQVDRVVPKYEIFIKRFSNPAKLARAPQREVLRLWSGLGYNRRALYLHRAAQRIVQDFKGKIPAQFDQLVSLPGVGKYTAGAVLAFAFNQPAIFLETNIRQVFIHFFFPKKKKVDDMDILPLVTKTLDSKNPRVWYWALMDYGSMLKREQGNLISRSRQYVKQSKFKGSLRQLRGQILALLLERGSITELFVQKHTGRTATEIKTALKSLAIDNFILKSKSAYRLK